MMGPYIRVMRIDNYPKNAVFLLGFFLALKSLDYALATSMWVAVLCAFVALCLAASANYVINEFLDVKTDVHHPLKKARTAHQQKLKPIPTIALYLALCAAALYLSSLQGGYNAGIMAVFLLCGAAYNIPPLRIKSRSFADVVLESVNFPLRVLMGWCALLPEQFPPSSVLIVLWAVGAFMMSLKRHLELAAFPSHAAAVAYRPSYRHYTLNRLLVAAVGYAMLAIFGFTVFLVKYRPDYIVLLPFLMLWLLYYLALTLRGNLAVLFPERLYKEKMVGLLSGAIILMYLWLCVQPLEWFQQLAIPN